MRRLYFLPVRGNLGGAELSAAFAAQGQGDIDNGNDGDNNNNAIGATTINDAAAIEEPAKAAVVVILTYAGFDITAARGVLDSLPECGGGVFGIVADVPAGAPFLPKLRQRADELQSNNNNAIMIMELTAAARRQQFDNAAAKVRAMVFDNAADGGNMADRTTMDDKTTTTTTSGAGIFGGYRQTPAEAVRAAYRAVRDLL